MQEFRKLGARNMVREERSKEPHVEVFRGPNQIQKKSQKMAWAAKQGGLGRLSRVGCRVNSSTMNRMVTCLSLLLPALALACVPKSGEGESQANSGTETTETETGTTETESETTETEESGTTTETEESGTTETEESGTTETEESGTTTETEESGTTETEESGTTETEESGTTETEESETTETETETGAGECEENDAWEDNDVPEEASVFEWGGGPHLDIYKSMGLAFLCSGEDDWYRFNVSTVEFDNSWYEEEDDPDAEYRGLHVDGIVQGSSWCGEGCEQSVLPDAPENTLGIEIYDAETLELLVSEVATDGRVDINANGEAFGHDLLMRVYGPSLEASYVYDVHFSIRAFDGEDECEC